MIKYGGMPGKDADLGGLWYERERREQVRNLVHGALFDGARELRADEQLWTKLEEFEQSGCLSS